MDCIPKKLTVAQVADYLCNNDTALQADSLSGSFECMYKIICNSDGLVNHPTGAYDEMQFSCQAEYLEEMLKKLEEENDGYEAWEKWVEKLDDFQTLANPDFYEVVQNLTDQANDWLQKGKE